MKKSRYTERQIVNVLKQADAGMRVKEILTQVRHLGCDVLQLEIEIRRHERLGAETPEGDRR